MNKIKYMKKVIEILEKAKVENEEYVEDIDRALLVLYNVSHRTSSDFLDSKEFYEIMQAYRHTHLARQGEATYWFEKVKQFIRDQSKAIPLPNYKISKDIT